LPTANNFPLRICIGKVKSIVSQRWSLCHRKTSRKAAIHSQGLTDITREEEEEVIITKMVEPARTDSRKVLVDLIIIVKLPLKMMQ
jgi:hypothetical protein